MGRNRRTKLCEGAHTVPYPMTSLLADPCMRWLGYYGNGQVTRSKPGTPGWGVTNRWPVSCANFILVPITHCPWLWKPGRWSNRGPNRRPTVRWTHNLRWMVMLSICRDLSIISHYLWPLNRSCDHCIDQNPRYQKLFTTNPITRFWIIRIQIIRRLSGESTLLCPWIRTIRSSDTFSESLNLDHGQTKISISIAMNHLSLIRPIPPDSRAPVPGNPISNYE